jgi:AcrR family transcriptional regulator
MPPVSTTTAHGGALKASPEGTAGRLLDTAASLFRAKGYGASTTRELAALLGIQNASLYHYIGKKEDLLYDLSVESLRNIHEQVSRAVAAESGGSARVRALVRAHVVSALADQDKHATMLIELRSLGSERRAEVLQLRDDYEALVRDTLVAAQGDGSIASDIPARHLTFALLNLLNWTIFWYGPGGDLGPEALADLFGRVFLSGVETRPAM